MKKIIKKMKIVFCIGLLLFGFFHRPKPVQAEGLTMGVGLTLTALNPAIIPIAVLGLFALILIGVTIENWDDVVAFGQQVANELAKAGHSVSEFVSGTSVTVNDTLKKAINNASNNLGNTMPKANMNTYLSYHGGLRVVTGVANSGTLRVVFSGDSKLYLGTKAPGGLFGGYTYNAKKDYLLQEITVIVDIQPTSEDVKFKRDYKAPFNPSGIIRNADNQIVQLSHTFTNTKQADDYFSVVVDGPKGMVVTGVTVPQLGLGERLEQVPTSKIKEDQYDQEVREKATSTAFPSASEVVTFSRDATLTGTNLLNLPKVSNKTYTDSQAKTLTDTLTGAGVNTNTGTGTAVDSLTGSLTGAGTASGLGWLSQLWEWLKKLLDAILGIPAAILAGLKALWDTLVKWLSDILSAIQSLGASITKAITDALTWAFGIDGDWLKGRLADLKASFDAKFLAITPINYRFQDKATFDDLTVFIPNVGNVVIVQGSMVMRYSPILKNFMRAFFYLITALFFFRRFYKVAED